MKLSRTTERRIRQERMERARCDLTRLRDALLQAYDVFNHTDDPALLEASILEISALQSKYGCLLRNIKALNEEMQDGTTRHSTARDPGGRGDHTDHAASEIAAQTYQMGI